MDIADTLFQTRWQNYENLIWVSSCLSVRQSDRPHGKTWVPLDGFPWNLIFAYFSKICWKNSS